MDINTLTALVNAVQDTKTAGYFVDFDIQPRNGSDFLIVDVSTNDPQTTIEGQWWFDADFVVVQVL